MRITFIIVLLLGSFFAFSREMEPGSEYYNLSVQLVRDISNLEFSACPDWTDGIAQQEFLCADFVGDARSFPNTWDASLARVSNDFNLEEALEWNIGALGINKMYSISDSIMSVTLESQGSKSQLVIYVAKPLTLDDFAANAASTSVVTANTVPNTSTQEIAVPLPQSNTSTASSSGVNIIIQPTQSAQGSSTNNTTSSALVPTTSTPTISTLPTSSNPTSTFSDVATSTVAQDFYGYPTYEAYVEAYKEKVTNPALSQTAPSQAGQAAQAPVTSVYSNSLPAYCITYPTRPECSGSGQQSNLQAVTQAQSAQSQMPFPNTPNTTSPSVQQSTQSFNGYPSYEAYLQAFRQQHAQGTQAAQSQSYSQQTPQTQGFAGFPSYEAYLEDYNRRYGQAGQVTSSNVTVTPTVVAPTPVTPAPATPTAATPSIQSTTTSTTTTSEATASSDAQTSTSTASSSDSSSSVISSTVAMNDDSSDSEPKAETDTNSSSQFQVSASSLGVNSSSPNSGSTDSSSASSGNSNSNNNSSDSNESSRDSNDSTEGSEILSLAPSRSETSILGKITTRGFRNVPWGSTPTRTKNIETWELVDEGLAKDEAYYLAYDGEILGAKVLAVYYFSPKTKILGRGAYIFMGADEANSRQVTRHTSLHNMLGKDYGTPNRNEKLWLNEDAKDMSDIDALATGDMLYVTQWDDNQIDVELSLFASSDELMNRVLYSSKLFSIVIDEEIN